MWRLKVFGILLWAARLPGVFGQEPDGRKWLSLSGELRGRVEWTSGEGGVNLTRLRFGATVEPVRWVRFHFQGQDARALTFNRRFAPGNAVDVRQGYIEVGHPEALWYGRAGRQALAIGDERLVGADAECDPLGQVFDAVRFRFGQAKARLDVFSGFLVKPGQGRPDPFDRSDQISGAAAQFKVRDGGSMFEPYTLWKRRPGLRDVATMGVRAAGRAPRKLDYNVEMAAQRGRVAGDRISAWAGHWELTSMPLGGESGPRLSFEYNFASGDANPGDGRHETFDDLYPAGYNRYGICDPFAWRNIRYPGVGVEWPLGKRWTLSGGYRNYWIADMRDGLYAGGDDYLFRNASATGTRIGSQAFFSAAYERSERWRVQAGYGQLFKGEYLRESEYERASQTVYVLTSFTF